MRLRLSYEIEAQPGRSVYAMLYSAPMNLIALSSAASRPRERTPAGTSERGPVPAGTSISSLRREGSYGRLERRATDGHHARSCSRFELHALWTRQCISKHRSSTGRFNVSTRLSVHLQKSASFGDEIASILKTPALRDCHRSLPVGCWSCGPSHSACETGANRFISGTAGRRAFVPARDRGQAGSRRPRARPAAGARAGSCPSHP